MEQPIIQSLLDTDLYKLTMQQIVHHRFPKAQAEFRFKCRTPGARLSEIRDAVREQAQALADVSATPEELAYLEGLGLFSSDYLEFLEDFRLKPRHVEIQASGDDLEIAIRGPWSQTILFEIPLLSIVNETYFRRYDSPEVRAEGRARLAEKIRSIRSESPTLRFSEFGTRRRFSADWQREVVASMAREIPGNMIGTSNVMLAREMGIAPIGTMAHEYLQACQALGPNLRDFQKFALEQWVQEYRGKLGIALTDVVGTDAFLEDFDLYFAKIYDGLRQDSGDPFAWGEKVLARYAQLGVDAAGKTLVFSDGLDIPKSQSLLRAFEGRARVLFGIGTNLTNDLGLDPLNIVIKMTRCDGKPVAKLSDSPGKTMSDDPLFIQSLQAAFPQGESRPQIRRKP